MKKKSKQLSLNDIYEQLKTLEATQEEIIAELEKCGTCVGDKVFCDHCDDLRRRRDEITRQLKDIMANLKKFLS